MTKLIEKLDSLAILLANDCEPDEQLDLLVRNAAALFRVPIAMINLVTSDEIVFKACVGQMQGASLDRSGMFCSYAVSQEEPLIVTDTAQDPFFRDCSLVTGPLAVRSYAGKSLYAPDGSLLGTLCLLDTKPKTYSRRQLQLLCSLAECAEAQFERILRLNSRKITA